MGECRDFKLGTQLDRSYSHSPPTTNRPWKGRGYGHVTHLNSQSP